MDLVSTGVVRLDDRMADSFPDWRGADREGVTVRDLLEHASGLPARLLEAPPSTPREFEHDICTMPLAYAPRTQSIYSDLGFILLGRMAEARSRRLLNQQFDAIRARLSSVDSSLAEQTLTFKLSGSSRARAAPTWPQDDDLRRGRMLDRGCARSLRRCARRRRGSRRAVWHGRRGRRLCAPRPSGRSRWHDAVTDLGGVRRDVYPEERGRRQFARARVGHDVADIIVRKSNVPRRDRSRRFHRDLALDRPASGSLLRPAHQPRLSAAVRWLRCATFVAHFTTPSTNCESTDGRIWCSGHLLVGLSGYRSVRWPGLRSSGASARISRMDR